MAEYVYFYALKLEIDEGLDLGTLHLDNQIITTYIKLIY